MVCLANRQFWVLWARGIARDTSCRKSTKARWEHAFAIKHEAPGLLQGHEEKIVHHLRYEPNGECCSKQRAFRVALRELGLGDVATGGAAFRRYVHFAWNAARLPKPNRRPKPTRCEVPRKWEEPEEEFTELELQTLDIHVRELLPKLLGSPQYLELRQCGAVLLPGLFPPSVAKRLKALRPDATTCPHIRAHRSKGDGEHARYLDWDHLSFSMLAKRLGAHIANIDGDVEAPKHHVKSVLLEYGEGGVNWLHQDANPYPFQALVMLSDPRTDFEGGQLYVARQVVGNRRQEHEITFQRPGDVAIFCANGDFYHGTRTITKSVASTCLRIVVGLLQPDTKKCEAVGKSRKEAQERNVAPRAPSTC